MDCTSVPVVINANGELWGGATHNDNNVHSRVYMPEYLDRILKATGLVIEDLPSMSLGNLVAGDETQHKQNAGYLERFGIPLAPYRRFEEIPGFIDFLFRGNIAGGEKKVLIIPELQEVIMYYKPVGYIQLI